MPLLATLTSFTLMVDDKSRLTLAAAEGLVTSKERNGGEHFPQPYLQPFSHTASSCVFPAHLWNSWFLKGSSEGLQRCPFCEDTSAKQTLSGQGSAQYCCQIKQDPSTYFPPGISQAEVKKSWKGKKGPGGETSPNGCHICWVYKPRPKPPQLLSSPFSAPGIAWEPEVLGRWDGCQPHCWKTSQHQPTLALSASIHSLSPVSCLASQHPGDSVHPSSVQHPAAGLLAPAEVTNSYPESSQSLHAVCSRRCN